MKPNNLRSLSFADLRDRLKARADQSHNVEELDLNEVLRYLVALPDEKQTKDSVDAVLQLGRNFHYETRPAEGLQAALHAARFAVSWGDELLLYNVRALEGVSLSDLGRFAEATVAYGESWSLARSLGDREREVWAIGNIGTMYGGMGQFEVAMRYFEKARSLAEELGFAASELQCRINLADCAAQLRDAASGFQALSRLATHAPQSKRDMAVHAAAHNTLARLYLIVGNSATARVHLEESNRMSLVAKRDTTIRSNEAILGLIEVSSGAAEKGLAAVERALAYAKQSDRTSLPDCLGVCIDAYETAGYSDKALAYLQELIDLKKASIDAEVSALRYEALSESAQLQAETSSVDGGLFARAQSLQADVQDRIERLLEIAINAEMVGGHDLYRTFRVARLARCLGEAIGWNEERVAPLALGAQLCNIGMMAIPARILQKPRGLSAGERDILRDHTLYGAELLRKSKIRILEVASVIAEQHHERYDGSGYPRAISGDAIAEEARIVAICDAFDAMTHRRPWRPNPLSIQAALNELKRGTREQFDALFVEKFVDVVQREFSQHEDFDAFLGEAAYEIEYVRARVRMESFIGEAT